MHRPTGSNSLSASTSLPPIHILAVLAQLLVVFKADYKSNHSFLMLNSTTKLNYCEITDKKEILYCSTVLWILKSNRYEFV